MRYLAACLISLLICLPAGAQSLLVGQVLDAKGRPLMAANVYWKGLPSQGAISDWDGRFELEWSMDWDDDTLVVRFPGYQVHQQAFRRAQTTDPCVIRLRTADLTLAEVQIQGRKPISEQFAVVQISRMDVYMNPLAAGDPLRAITGLAASTNTEESANPSLRGSSADRSRVVLDGVPIYQPVRNSQLNGLGLFSLFNTELIQTQYVFPSNPPLTFGNTSAGLVQIETLEKVSRADWQLSTSMANVGLIRTQPLGRQGAFMQVYGNAQFSPLFTGVNQPALDFLQDFGSEDLGAKSYWPINARWTLKAFSYGIRERYQALTQVMTHQGTVRASKLRSFHILSLRRQGDQDQWALHVGGDWSRTRFAFGNMGSLSQEQRQYASLGYKRYAGRGVSWEAGVNYDAAHRATRDTSARYYFALQPEAPIQIRDTQWFQSLLEGYLYGNWEINSRWHLSAGIRRNWPLGEQEPFWSAQMGLRYAIGESHRWLLHAGRYHSYSLPGIRLPLSALLQSDQLALDYQFQQGNTRLQAAYFLKQETGPQFEDPVIISSARIMGIEGSWEQQLGDQLLFSVAGTYLLHRVRFESAGQAYPGSRDLPIFIKSQGTYQHPRIGSLSITWVGRPGTWFTPVLGGELRPELMVYEPLWGAAINTERTGAYHNLSLGFSRYATLRWGEIVVFVNVNNVFDRLNEQAIRYAEDFTRAGWEAYSRRTWYAGVVWYVKMRSP